MACALFLTSHMAYREDDEEEPEVLRAAPESLASLTWRLCTEN